MAEWNAGGARIAVQQLELAMQGGSYQAAYMLATIMLSGLGGTAAHGGPLAGMGQLQRRVPCSIQIRGGARKKEGSTFTLGRCGEVSTER